MTDRIAPWPDKCGGDAEVGEGEPVVLSARKG